MKSVFVMLNMVLVWLVLLSSPQKAFAQAGTGTFGNGASNTAKNEQQNDHTMGALSMVTGAGIMAGFMPCAVSVPPNPACMFMAFAVGPGLMMTGMGNKGTGDGRQTSIDPTLGGYGGGGYTTGDGMAGGPLPPDLQAAVNDALNTAKSFGIDPSNPDSIAAARAKAGPLANSDDGAAQALSQLSPDQLAQLEKIKADVASKFNVSSVATEGGGGGGIHKGHSDDVDIAKLLGGSSNGGVGLREPASIEGLSKDYNGNLIGLATDDIFKKITKCYQGKINAKKFLTDTKKMSKHIY